MVFADPTHRRIYVLSVILLALALACVYLHLFYPFVLTWFRYSVLTVRFRTVVAFNRVFIALAALNFIKLFVYAFSAKKAKQPARGEHPHITAVIPAYNEEKTIEKVVTDTRRALPDAVVYVYDNNSTDRIAVLQFGLFG